MHKNLLLIILFKAKLKNRVKVYFLDQLRILFKVTSACLTGTFQLVIYNRTNWSLCFSQYLLYLFILKRLKKEHFFIRNYCTHEKFPPPLPTHLSNVVKCRFCKFFALFLKNIRPLPSFQLICMRWESRFDTEMRWGPQWFGTIKRNINL